LPFAVRLNVEVIARELVSTNAMRFSGISWPERGAKIPAPVPLTLTQAANPTPIRSSDVGMNSKLMAVNAMCFRACVVTILCPGVLGVLLGSTCDQVIRVAAGRDIALVEDVESLWDLTLPERVGESMRAPIGSAVTHVAVLEFRPKSLVDPTAREWIDQALRLESLTIVLVSELLAPESSTSLSHMLTVQLCDKAH
jgi:hypothetical protein